MSIQNQNQSPMFKLDDRGRYTSVDTSQFKKLVEYKVETGTLKRNIRYHKLNKDINFTEIDNSLYLSSKDFQEIFGVTRQTVESHLNNIYGDYLNIKEAGTTCTLDTNMIIKVLSVQTNGGVQNVSYYHHDIFLELASRINTPDSRLIKMWVKKIIHDYNKYLCVVNPDILKTENAKELGSFFLLSESLMSAARVKEKEKWNFFVNEILALNLEYTLYSEAEKEITRQAFSNSIFVHVFGFSENDFRSKIIDTRSHTLGLNYIPNNDLSFDEYFNVKHFLNDEQLSKLANFYERLTTWVLERNPKFYDAKLKDIYALLLDNWDRSTNRNFDKYVKSGVKKDLYNPNKINNLIKNFIKV